MKFLFSFLTLSSIIAYCFCDGSTKSASLNLTRDDFESQTKGQNVLVAFHYPR